MAAARSEIISTSLIDQEQAEKERFINDIASVNVVEASHPYSEPVTYDEAALQIWPQIANAPALRVKPEGEEEEPTYAPEAKEEAPVEEKPVEQPGVVEASHPYSEPVTYEEAVLQIWPQVANAPLLRAEEKQEQQPAKQKVEELAPVKEEIKEQPHVEPQQVVEEKPQQVVEEKPQPAREARVLSFDEAALEVWPQLAYTPKPAKKKAPAKKAEPVKEQPVKVQPKVKEAPKPEPKVKKEQPVEPKPANVPEYKHPYSKPVSYNEAALEIWPQIANAPALRVADEDEEAPVVDLYVEPENKPEPVKEKPVKEKKAPKKKQEPKPEPKKEQPKEAPKAKKAPEKKAAPVQKAKPAAKKKEKPVIPVRVVEKPREKIPGRFIVKLLDGYYVNDKKVSPYKEDAKVFDDFNLAKDIKKERGGKVVKL